MDARYRCPEPIVALIKVIVKSLGVGPRSGPGRRGRPATSLRRICNSIWYRMRTGRQWRAIPATDELANGSTAHEWFKRWAEAGVFVLLHLLLVALYVEDGRAQLRRLGIDCTLVPAPLGCEGSGPNPADRGKEGMKVSVAVDEAGVPLALHVAGANIPDFKLLGETLAELAGPVLDALAQGKIRPELVADKGYDYNQAREQAAEYGFTPRFAKRRASYRRASKKVRRVRANTERAAAWLKSFRGVRLCWARKRCCYLAAVALAAGHYVLRALPKKVRRAIAPCPG